MNIFHTISRRYLYLHGEAWGCYSPQGIVPLLIENGGTGSTSLAGAKTNLQINRLAQDPSVTSMYAPTSDSRIVITDNSWGVLSINPNFNPALGTSHGGTGNTQGIAPSANKLQNARRINNAYFDGTGDIDITAARRFHGQILVKNLHLATSDGVYEVTGDGSILGLYDDESKNSIENINAGKFRLSYDYGPVPPLEDLGFYQMITDDYLADFGARITA